MRCLKHLSNDERVPKVSVEKRRLRGDLTNPYKYFQAVSENGDRLCSVVRSDRVRSMSMN